jgi:hypothetical protein
LEGYALATLDFEGSLGSVQVSSLGVERIPVEREADSWVPVESLAPRLAAVVAALDARRWALEVGDGVKLAALTTSRESRTAQQDELFRRLATAGRRYRPAAWYIRLERTRALVTEDFWIGGGDDRGPEEKGTRSLTLERRGSQFLFSGSLL